MAEHRRQYINKPIETFMKTRLILPHDKLLLIAKKHRLGDTANNVEEVEETYGRQTEVESCGFCCEVIEVVEEQEVN